jgi:hypothetical protein
MKKLLIFCLAFLANTLVWAQAELVAPVAMLTGDVRSIGLRVPDYKFFVDELSRGVGIACYLNGKQMPTGIADNNMTEDGRITLITSRQYHDTGEMYYRAPFKMPSKNPVELKVVYTTRTGKVLTLTKNIYVVAQNWKFYHVHGLKSICPEDAPINSMATLGAVSISLQNFHFSADSFNPKTGEANGTLDGEPTIFKFRLFQTRGCDPEHFEVAANWGKDIFTKIKDVKPKFSSGQMHVDFKIDYMDYLAWKARALAPGADWVQVVPPMKGTKDASGQLVAPLQKEYKKQYLDKTSKLLLHVTSGYSLQAAN